MKTTLKRVRALAADYQHKLSEYGAHNMATERAWMKWQDEQRVWENRKTLKTPQAWNPQEIVKS